jgi:hypothetical protein
MYLCLGKKNINSIQLEVDGTLLSKSYEVAEAFSKQFIIITT